jgi:hypothetical protein
MTTEVQGNGATITIDAAYESDTIEMYSSDSWNDAEGRPVGNVEAREDGKYVVVETTVVNDTSSDMDLTCRSTGGWVEATLQVKDGSVYQPIQELYEIPDNPECNSNLGPGFDTEMTWAFLVPDDREPSTFSFKSDSAPNDETPTAIRLDKIGEKPEVDDSAPAPTPGNAEDGTPAVPTAEPAPLDIPVVPEPGTEPPAGSPVEDPVIGFTGAPGVDQPRVLDKQISSCGDPALHQTGTTFFTDGTSGWTEQCSAQMMQ